MKFPTLLFAIMLVAPTASAAIYRCKDANGRPLFSDTPCGVDAIKIQTGAAPSAQAQFATVNSARQRRVELELQRLDEQEKAIYKARASRGRVSKVRIDSENDELESIRRQKRALLGVSTPGSEQDERLRRVEQKLRDAERPAIEDFRLNGRNCTRTLDEIRCH